MVVPESPEFPRCFRNMAFLPGIFPPGLGGIGTAGFESVCWVLVSPGSGQVRRPGPYLAHVREPALLPLVYEAVDDEARLSVQSEV